MEKVSVIIPCFNDGKFIKKAISSILSQTFKSLHIIIVNDGSTDQFTISFLQSLNNTKIDVYHIDNSGPSYARNFGISKANSEIIVTLDADDWFENTFIGYRAATGTTSGDHNICIGYRAGNLITIGNDNIIIWL